MSNILGTFFAKVFYGIRNL